MLCMSFDTASCCLHATEQCHLSGKKHVMVGTSKKKKQPSMIMMIQKSSRVKLAQVSAGSALGNKVHAEVSMIAVPPPEPLATSSLPRLILNVKLNTHK